MKKINSLFFTIFSLISVHCVFSQQVSIDSFKMDQFDFISSLAAWRKDNPDVSVADFANKAEELFNTKGINFSFLLDQKNCTQIKELKDKQKDRSEPLQLGGSLRSVDGDAATLSFPEPEFDVSECGRCQLSFSTLEITANDFISVVEGRNVKFYLPPNLVPSTASLVDAKDPNIIKQTFRIPFRSEPIGISHDETVLYLEFPHPELKELSLLVYSEGGFRIGTRADAEEGGKGIEVRSEQSDHKLKRFDRWQKTYVIKYKEACKN